MGIQLPTFFPPLPGPGLTFFFFYEHRESRGFIAGGYLFSSLPFVFLESKSAQAPLPFPFTMAARKKGDRSFPFFLPFSNPLSPVVAKSSAFFPPFGSVSPPPSREASHPNFSSTSARNISSSSPPLLSSHSTEKIKQRFLLPPPPDPPGPASPSFQLETAEKKAK